MAKTVAIFIGTRPEAIKMAPVVAAIERTPGLSACLIATGQHREMLAQVVQLFDLRVDRDLDVMTPGQSLAGLSARLLTAIDAALESIRPDFALVQGDTTTVLMAALACFYRKVPVGHVEAGLRTGDISSPFPEEANRKLAAPLVGLHFPPTKGGRENLLAEGVPEEKILVTGNTVIDALQHEVAQQRHPAIAKAIHAALAAEIASDWADVPYVLVTGHRRENFGEGFAQICDALAALAKRFSDHRFIYPVHLNPQVRDTVFERLGRCSNIHLLPPKDYRHFVALMHRSRLVLTDSGGVQEEAPSLGKPVLVMRDTTERPEGVEAGTVRLVGADSAKITSAVSELLTDASAYEAMARAENPYGDGHAGARIAARVASFLDRSPQARFSP